MLLFFVLAARLLIAPPDDLAAAKSYIQGKWTAQANRLLHPEPGKEVAFWEENCVAGFQRFTPRGDPQSFSEVLKLHIESHRGERFLNADIRVTDIKKVEGGFGVLTYTAYKSVTDHRSFLYHEIQQQFWIKTRKGYGLRCCQVLYWHSAGKDFSLFTKPAVQKALWHGPPLKVPPELIQELKSSN